MKKVELIIALKYLGTKSREGFISVVSAFSLLGIALGVATLIVVMSVMSGYENQLISRLLGMSGHISLRGIDSDIHDFEQLAENTAKIQYVKFADPLINGQAIVATGDQARGAIIKGMSAKTLLSKSALQPVMSSAELQAYQENEGILIGEEMSKELGVSAGGYLKLIAPKFENLAFGSMPRMKSFKVIGTFDVGMHEHNHHTIFMPLKLAQIFFGHKNTVTDLEITLEDITKSDFVTEQIIKHNYDTGLSIIDWTSSNEPLIEALRIERSVMFFILSLIILIAVFNIISSLVMLVQDKKKSIAILRTIGLTRNSLLRIFMICGCFIGVAGTLIGAAIGIVFTLHIENIKKFLESLTGYTLFDPVIYFLTQLPAELSLQDIIFVCSLSVSLTFLSTIYPAWKAASIMPAVALRYE